MAKILSSISILFVLCVAIPTNQVNIPTGDVRVSTSRRVENARKVTLNHTKKDALKRITVVALAVLAHPAK